MNVSKALLLEFIAGSTSKVSFSCLKQHFKISQPLAARALKRLVTDLVQTGDLAYTSHYGSAFVALAYDRPRMVSEHVGLKPPTSSWWAGAGRTAVVLENGASFGDGTHPTTGMAIQLLDALLYPTCRSKTNQCLNAIDIGTGSGVLAIVAARLGVGTVCGLDIDPCARYEARENIRLNDLCDRVVIRDDSLTGVAGPYDLVLANLRTPTLIDIKAELQKKVSHDSALILSGMKAEESDLVNGAYQKAGFFTVNKKQKQGWCAICLMRGAWLGVSRGL